MNGTEEYPNFDGTECYNSTRHNLLIEFLKMVGLSDEITNRDVESIEHQLRPTTLEKLDAFIKIIKNKDLRF